MSKQAEASARWRAANPERAREVARNWYARNREQARAAARARYASLTPEEIEHKRRRERAADKMRRARQPEKELLRARKKALHRKYGMTIEQFNAMAATQNHRCASCGDRAYRLVVDHDHETGRVRSLLCDCCNRGLGSFRDDASRLESAIAYLRRHSIELS